MPFFQKLNRVQKIHRPKNNNQYKHNYLLTEEIKPLSLFFLSNIRVAQSFLPTCTRAIIFIFILKQKKRISNCNCAI